MDTPKKPEKTALVTNMLIHRCGQQKISYDFMLLCLRQEAGCPLLFPNNNVFSAAEERPGLACILLNIRMLFFSPNRRGKTIPEPVLPGKVFLPRKRLKELKSDMLPASKSKSKNCLTWQLLLGILKRLFQPASVRLQCVNVLTVYGFVNIIYFWRKKTMPADIKVDQVLDAKGMSCPLPILKTKKAVEALSKGQILKVETTDAGSKNDMASWAKRTGNEIVKVEEGSGTFTFYIKKTA
jgi:TusA-related sulfurtransferase